MNVGMIPGTKRSLISLVDITERKHNEQRLRESEARFRDIAEYMPAMIAELDLELNVTYLNKAGLESFGYTDEDLKNGVNARAAIHPDFQEKANEDLANILAGEFGRQQEYRMVRKNGSTMWIIINSAPLKREL